MQQSPAVSQWHQIKKENIMCQYTGYVSEVALKSPAPGAYGSYGFLQIELTSLPYGRGESVPGVALYHLSQGATVPAAVAGYLLAENQLLTLLLAYSNAAANQTCVWINTESFVGGFQVLDVGFMSK
jgi:hypothetical protein